MKNCIINGSTYNYHNRFFPSDFHIILNNTPVFIFTENGGNYRNMIYKDDIISDNITISIIDQIKETPYVIPMKLHPIGTLIRLLAEKTTQKVFVQ